MDVSKIANKIKSLRADKEWTQKDLGDRLNVSSQLISKWETGESIPSLEYLDALCGAFGVPLSYFTDDRPPAPETPVSAPTPAETAPAETIPPETPKKTRGLTRAQLGGIVGGSIGAVLVVAVLLIVFLVTVPAIRGDKSERWDTANRTEYLAAVENSIDEYLQAGYYNIVITGERDGDEVHKTVLQGYIDENGKAAYYNSATGTVCDGIRTDDIYKYIYVQPQEIRTLSDLLESQMQGDVADDFDLEKIKSIRASANGYAFIMEDGYFTDELTGTQKKNIRLNDAIRGEVVIKDGCFVSMSITIKYTYKPDNEDFVIGSKISMVREKPIIAHKNLDGLRWCSDGSEGDPNTYLKVGDGVTDIHTFMQAAGAKQSSNALSRDLFSSHKIAGYADGYVYYGESWYSGYISIYNVADGTGVRMDVSDLQAATVYGGILYWANKEYVYSYDPTTDTKRTVHSLSFPTDETCFADGKCYVSYLYEGKTRQVDLKTGQATTIDGIKIRYVYGDWYVYYHDAGLNARRRTDSESTAVRLPFASIELADGARLYGYGADSKTVYAVELTTSGVKDRGSMDRRVSPLSSDYHAVAGGYCLTDENVLYSADGKQTAQFETIVLRDDNDSYCGYRVIEPEQIRIKDVWNGKLVVEMLGYEALFDPNDLTRPICYTSYFYIDRFRSGDFFLLRCALFDSEQYWYIR